MSAASCESGYIYQVYVQWPDVLVSSSNNPLTPATELLASRTIVSFLPLPLPASFSLSLSLYRIRPRYTISGCIYTRIPSRKNLLFTELREQKWSLNLKTYPTNTRLWQESSLCLPSRTIFLLRFLRLFHKVRRKMARSRSRLPNQIAISPTIKFFVFFFRSLRRENRV